MHCQSETKVAFVQVPGTIEEGSLIFAKQRNVLTHLRVSPLNP